MSYKTYAIPFILLSLIISSCTKANLIRNNKDKETYIEQLSELSEKEIDQELRNEIKDLQEILDQCDNLEIYTGMSLKIGSDVDQEITESEEPFLLLDKDSATKYIEDNKTLYANQLFEFPNSEIKIELGRIKDGTIKDLTDSYDIKKYFYNNTAIDKNDVGLKSIDSVLVESHFCFPTSFETLVLNYATADSIQYKDQMIYYFKGDDEKSLQIDYPLELNLIGYQAITPNGYLMNSNSKSKFPIIGLNPIAKNNILLAIRIMEESITLNNKDLKITKLNEIQEESYQYIYTITNLSYELNTQNINNIIDNFGVLSSFLDKYNSIFAARKQRLNLSFPSQMQEIHLYIANEYSSTTTEDIVTINKFSNYNVFKDKNTQRYGIVDNKGNIILQANYDKLHQGSTDSLYYYTINESETKIDTQYLLNVSEARLDPFPKDYIYLEHLDDEHFVVTKPESSFGLKGLLDKNKKELIPFNYNKFEKIDNKLLVAKKSIRGRNYYDFYTIDGKLLDIPTIKSYAYEKSSNAIIIQNRERNYGLMSTEGKVIVPPNLYTIDYITPHLFEFVTSLKIDNDHPSSTRIPSGIIDDKGEILIDEKLYFITLVSPTRITASINLDNSSSILTGCFDLNGKVIIPFEFLEIGYFIKGYTLARHFNGNYYIFDEMGNMVKDFKSTHVEEDYIEDEDIYCYKSDNKTYNYKGELTD